MVARGEFPLVGRLLIWWCSPVAARGKEFLTFLKAGVGLTMWRSSPSCYVLLFSMWRLGFFESGLVRWKGFDVSLAIDLQVSV